MSEKLSKEEQMKLKIQKQQEERNARKTLMSGQGQGQDSPEDNVNIKVEVEDSEKYTITIDPLVLRMKHPEQTFGMKAKRTELIGCFFEPEVEKVFKADQKKKGRGWQSHLVNELVKEYYKSKGKL